MMSMMKMKLSGKFMSLLIVGAVLATMVPLVSAYESYMINVKVHVKERFKVVEAASTDNISYLVESGAIPEDWNPVPGDPYEVPTHTCVVWLVTITVCNTHDYTMYDLVVTDRFGAELGSDPTVDVIVQHVAPGRWKKTEEPNQYRIDWYVGDLAPGECAKLELLAWTRLNPAGKQEYTSPGTYTLNSGPTAKWLDPYGHQFSLEGEPWYIEAVD